MIRKSWILKAAAAGILLAFCALDAAPAWQGSGPAQPRGGLPAPERAGGLSLSGAAFLLLGAADAMTAARRPVPLPMATVRG